MLGLRYLGLMLPLLVFCLRIKLILFTLFSRVYMFVIRQASISNIHLENAFQFILCSQVGTWSSDACLTLFIHVYMVIYYTDNFIQGVLFLAYASIHTVLTRATVFYCNLIHYTAIRTVLII